MDRKGIVAVVLAIIVMLVWQVKFAPKPSPASAAASPSPGASPSAAPGVTGVAVVSTTGTVGATTLTTGSASTAPSVPEQITTLAGPAARYHFTNLGGGIAQAELTGYPAESGSNVTLNEFGTVPIGAISDKPGEGTNSPYTISHDGNALVAVRDQPGGLSISKKFTLPASLEDAHGYRVALEVTFTNHASTPLKSDGYYLQVGSANPIHQKDQTRYTTFDWAVQASKATHSDVNWFNASKIPLLGIERSPEKTIYTADADKIVWDSVSSQFFTTVIAPQNGALASGVWAHRFPVKTESLDGLAVEGAIKMPGFTVAAGQSVTQSFEIYAGPKIYNVLKGLGDGQERILNFGMLSVVSVFLLDSMNWLHSVTGSYAIAIIILTLCIRGALWPLQNKATASMRQMQELAPRQAELKEKYKDDPARLNTEVMKLFKEYNVNPLAGCLPMVVQLPIFWGFFGMLGTAVELRNSKFLWVHDLSQPDTLFHLAGYPVNVLPLCMAATMFASMQLNPKTGDQTQQRMFMFMPLIFVAFCYNYASALALYWTVQNLFSIVQLYVTKKRTAPAPLKLAPTKRRSR